jgi:plasmid rolling circle replication initiator protein Rep
MSITEKRGVDNPQRTPGRIIDRPLLRQVSPKDAKWDDRAGERDQVRDLYRGTLYDALAGKIQGCSGRLGFGWGFVGDVLRLKLQSAWFCRVRYCPVCQWRKSLVWRARAFKVIPNIIAAYPSHRWLALTLTVRNCEIGELRETLGKMGKAWTRLTKFPQWPAAGWLRSVEVTRGKDGSAHPHYHCLLLVPAAYFSTGYIKQAEWESLWQQALKVDYPPNVHISAVTGKKGRGKESIPITEAILETLQYSVKPSDLVEDQGWLVGLTTQMKNLRTVATGGVLKEFFKEIEDEPKDLIHVNEDGEKDDSIASIFFDWEERFKRYVQEKDHEL